MTREERQAAIRRAMPIGEWRTTTAVLEASGLGYTVVCQELRDLKLDGLAERRRNPEHRVEVQWRLIDAE